MKKGMTLIEVLISSVILAISITALMYSFVINDRIVTENSHRFEAERILSDYFEIIENLHTKKLVNDFISEYITGTNGNFSGGYPNATPKKIQMIGVDTIATTYYIEFDQTSIYPFGGNNIYKDPSIYKIIGRVRWIQNNQQKELKMTMFTNEN